MSVSPHAHILPMKTGVPVRPRAMADHAILAQHAAKIRALL